MRVVKVYFPETKGVIRLMAVVYIILLAGGSAFSLILHETLAQWAFFLLHSLLYILVCSLIYFAIKSQRIIITEKQFILKVIGITRHKIDFEHIRQVRKGKMSGSPIMEILAVKGSYSKVCPVPFLPFSESWDELLMTIEKKCGSSAIGNMDLKRRKGEIRSWREN
ncbi:hypothetical protein FZC84_07315 [Rossellomorea vietnamensis]|uniref:DUF304 domain-containing protein n=1 Tax=Rossellomorea vietnamensis TaxID=218284 RepID=A0A5D4MFA3_9BACI|nr:hypothetical protein [Rossellomorea vietnamensis]TYS00342.1 hypothetical protein FZC84_07315 [Rossellomorea vietnamensis]